MSASFRFAKVAPILRMGVLLSLFALGWYLRGVFMENVELKEARKALIAGNKALVEYQIKIDDYSKKLEDVEKKLNEENIPSCNDLAPYCIRRGIDLLRRSEQNV
jgi:hypothetical protein